MVTRAISLRSPFGKTIYSPTMSRLRRRMFYTAPSISIVAGPGSVQEPIALARADTRVHTSWRTSVASVWRRVALPAKGCHTTAKKRKSQYSFVFGDRWLMCFKLRSVRETGVSLKANLLPPRMDRLFDAHVIASYTGHTPAKGLGHFTDEAHPKEVSPVHALPIKRRSMPSYLISLLCLLFTPAA
jgi:hypothetical protein